MSVLLLILGIGLFIGLVVVHEFGHFIMARRNGVDVEEFGIFFPPRLYKHRTKGGWDFTINLLPVGGFVKLKGEHDSDTEPGSFGAATVWAKTKIMGAGVVMNLITAFVLLTIVSLIGMPQIVPNQFNVKRDTHVISQSHTKVLVSLVDTNSPAQKAGLKTNDVLTGVGPAGHVQPVSSVANLQAVVQKYAGQPVAITYSRGDKMYQTSATLNSASLVQKSKASAHPTGYLGVGLDEANSGVTTQRATWAAPIVAVGTAWQFTVLTFQGLGHAIAGLGSIIAGFATNNHVANSHGQIRAGSQVGGPLAIFFVLKDGTALGLPFTLFIIAIISLTLAIMNIMPIPGLDGGRLWLTLITRALKKPLTPKLEERINGAGLAFLLTLLIVITVVDYKHFL